MLMSVDVPVRNNVQGSAYARTLVTGVGKSSTDGPRFHVNTLFKYARYCAYQGPSTKPYCALIAGKASADIFPCAAANMI